MQQTKNYKLNKPEMTDTFSTAPLSENADKLDAALTALDTAAGTLDQRMVKLENCRVMMGWYQGTGGTQTISLGERPMAVLAFYNASNWSYSGMAVGDSVCIDSSSSNVLLRLTEDGFTVRGSLNINYAAGYCYLAFFGGWPVKHIGEPPVYT